MKGPREILRWVKLRCAHCGHRFRWRRDSRHSFGTRDGVVYHGPCIAYITWRRTAEERLEVLRTVVNLTGVDGPTVTGLAELQAASETDRIANSNRAWRVFRDLTKTTETEQENTR